MFYSPMRMIEYSHDGTTWFSTAHPGWLYRREIEDLPEDLPKLDIEKWIKERQGFKIEYSYDGGHSYTTFRIKNASEDSGRIVTLLKMHHKVRFIRIEDANSVVTPAFRPANNRSQIRVMTKINFIYKKNDGSGWFSGDDKPGRLSYVTQHIPMTMAEPNVNNVSADIIRLVDPIIRGHIYKIFYIDSADGMDEETVKYFESMTVDSISQYCLVETPRSYDAETEEALGGTFACAVLASAKNKYYVHSRHNPYKIGDTFFVKKAAVSKMEESLRDYGATVTYDMRAEATLKHGEITDVIMELDAKLREAIDSGDSRNLTVALYEAVKLRDDTVGALEQLVDTIQKARAKVKQMVEHPE